MHNAMTEINRLQEAVIGRPATLEVESGKLMDEVLELRNALLDEKDLDHARDEVGDAIFAAYKMAYLLGIDPQAAYAKTEAKVLNRLTHIQQRRAAGSTLSGAIAEAKALFP